MSLKAFHLVFVTVSVLLCLGLGGWWIWEWQSGRVDAGLWYGMGWLLAGSGLVWYGRRVLRKLKGISYL
jgi:hypothetical protein